MRNLTLKVTAIMLLSMVSLSGAQAAKADSNSGSQAEHSGSFWDGWFPRSEKVERKTEVSDSLKKQHKSKDKRDKRRQESNNYFSDQERSKVRDYYREGRSEKHSNKGKKHKSKNKGKQLPPGLQKKLERGGQLPPGWQTKIARGEVLDGELLRHSEAIPYELARRLPALRDGEVVRRVGDKVVRVLEGNGTIIDVIDLADELLH